MNGILDIRTLASEWSDEIDDGEVTRDYVELCDALGVDHAPHHLEAYGDDYEPTMIAESYFVEYAQELAEDIGAIDSDARWPAYCIDWERAARDLAMDYSLVTFDGSDYYIRSC